jgi:hypothetical protein
MVVISSELCSIENVSYQSLIPNKSAPQESLYRPAAKLTRLTYWGCRSPATLISLGQTSPQARIPIVWWSVASNFLDIIEEALSQAPKPERSGEVTKSPSRQIKRLNTLGMYVTSRLRQKGSYITRSSILTVITRSYTYTACSPAMQSIPEVIPDAIAVRRPIPAIL